MWIEFEGDGPMSIREHDDPGKVEIAEPDGILVEKLGSEGVRALYSLVLRGHDDKLLRSGGVELKRVGSDAVRIGGRNALPRRRERRGDGRGGAGSIRGFWRSRRGGDSKGEGNSEVIIHARVRTS